MKPAITKGPWRVEPFIVDGETVSIKVRGPAKDDNERGLILAQTSYASDVQQRICYVETEAQALANAQAIAAVHDLLAVAIEVDRLLTKQKWIVDGPDPESQLLAAARAAITKAVGEQQ
ncbi:hypothetical protein [Cupriavidus oxalaticus]|uniref:Uncharacterized protein n=1 Tax=Cupriavidus oxalaticus TaxID=96344 RepID=A0A976GBI9_9BURK|nr:hypothetical protein [Cupriavidus oxalaticus]QRQ86285.1 hypothetical protein JTE91_24055 [Cupriavidus oxalaticus]QRQ95388.1 hypothetical protein JTE92_18205 [Cupriavidus oxalaticus]WQD84043.1 hypothetical protein U0036_05910 [Cupriavidus oxalaticus]SPC17355.1 hypothetical protein CO2235_90229 [Cupriavidus oxalaticus]